MARCGGYELGTSGESVSHRSLAKIRAGNNFRKLLAAAKQLLLMRPELDTELNPELSDVVYGLQILAGRQATDIYPEVYDTNGDDKVGMEDVLYKLSKLAHL